MAGIGAELTIINASDIERHECLGQGGFGVVYRCSHLNWGTVAVKQLIGVSLSADIRKEAQKMVRVVSSPYLVTIMGVVENPEYLGIVMEYLKNGSLKEFQQKYMCCDCWSRKVKMVQDIALGMNYLHTLNPPIIHRDLKLENVFLGNGFDAKIGDFGLAVSSQTSRKVSRVAGTRSHIPPEAMTSTAVEPDEFWDIYTFAITTYELTSGKDAWPQQRIFANDALIAAWVYKGHRPALDSIPEDAPEELIEVIKICWVAEPKERPIFIGILKTLGELFETKFKRGLHKADRAILEQMDIVHEAREGKTSAPDSGWGSLEQSSVLKCVSSDDGHSVDSAPSEEIEESEENYEEPPPSQPLKGISETGDQASQEHEFIRPNSEPNNTIASLPQPKLPEHTSRTHHKESPEPMDSDSEVTENQRVQITPTAIIIKELIKIGTGVYDKAKSMDDDKIGQLKEHLEVALSTLQICKKFEAKGILKFYSDKDELIHVGRVSVLLQERFNDVNESLHALGTRSRSKIRSQTWKNKYFKKQSAVHGTLKSRTHALKAGVDQLKKLIPQEKELHYIALYDFESEVPDDLPFKKGDKLFISDDTLGEWWLATSILTGKEGYIPSNYIQKVQSITEEEWYAGDIERKETEKKLETLGLPQGTFLIRENETKAGTCMYSLSFRDEADGKAVVRHYRIHKSARNQFYISESTCFNTLTELVAFYQKSADGLLFKLTKPYPKEMDELDGTVLDKWDIPRTMITPEKKLGNSSELTEVWQGTWSKETSHIPVAIQYRRLGTMESSAFLSQARIIGRLEHKNLLPIYGISSIEPVYLVTELIVNGSLHDYLIKELTSTIQFQQMIAIAAQIAAGMAVLEKENIIHRNLMSRSVLVGENNIFKVADYYLCVQGDDDGNFDSSKGADGIKFPTKWTAPEALVHDQDRTFSNKSDVWSFGILLMEIVTYGRIPYPDLTNREVLDRVIVHGYRMPKPDGCPDPLYRIMLDTWMEDQQSRPTFKSLQTTLADLEIGEFNDG